jgi:hypothetical protein
MNRFVGQLALPSVTLFQTRLKGTLMKTPHMLTMPALVPVINPSRCRTVIRYQRGLVTIPRNPQEFAYFVESLTDAGLFTDASVHATVEDNDRTIALRSLLSTDCGISISDVRVADLLAGICTDAPDGEPELTVSNIMRVANNIRDAISSAAGQAARQIAV